MKKLILKKDIIEVLDSMVQQSVMAGEAETDAGKFIINTSTRPNPTIIKPVTTITDTVRPPETQTCYTQCQTSYCC